MNMCFRAGRTDRKARTPDAPRGENLVSPGAQLSPKAASEDGRKRCVISFVRGDSGAGTGARSGLAGGPWEALVRGRRAGLWLLGPRQDSPVGSWQEEPRRSGGTVAARRVRGQATGRPLVMRGVWSARRLGTHPGPAVWLGVGVKGALSRQSAPSAPQENQVKGLSGAERRKWWLGLAPRTDGQVDRNTACGQGPGPSQAAPARRPRPGPSPCRSRCWRPRAAAASPPAR